jgi:hypothetical protein
MDTRTSEKTKHEPSLPVEEGSPARPDQLSQTEQQPNLKQQTTQERLRLPEREVLRRLWRIYEMALAAANHAKHL